MFVSAEKFVFRWKSIKHLLSPFRFFFLSSESRDCSNGTKNFLGNPISGTISFQFQYSKSYDDLSDNHIALHAMTIIEHSYLNQEIEGKNDQWRNRKEDQG